MKKFLALPQTRPGWWAVGLAALFVVLFLLKTSVPFPLPAMIIMVLGIVSAVLGLWALIRKGERSWLLWLLLLPGLFAIAFSAGELLYPH